MSGGLHLEQYIENIINGDNSALKSRIAERIRKNCLQNLPTELQHNFNVMRELDKKAQDIMQSIDQKSDDYLRAARHMSPEKKSEQMSAIQKMYNRAKEYSDDKVQLSIQTYELVDKHIRRLDADLAKFEAEIKDKNSKKEDEPPNVKSRKKKIQEKVKSKKKGSDEEDVSKKRKRKKTQETESSIRSVLPIHSIAHPSDVLDMPVDPNEPTYCLCHQVSYGEMIACDRADCPIEWFHFACVGLTIKPKGRWYCPRCSADRKKK